MHKLQIQWKTLSPIIKVGINWGRHLIPITALHIYHVPTHMYTEHIEKNEWQKEGLVGVRTLVRQGKTKLCLEDEKTQPLLSSLESKKVQESA